MDDPKIMEKIRQVLTPQEFTKVDGIIDLVFSTAEDVKKEEDVTEPMRTTKTNENRSLLPSTFGTRVQQGFRNILASLWSNALWPSILRLLKG